MNESIYPELLKIEKENKEAYLAIVIDTKGITSCRKGAKMIIFPDGKITGTIGGGEVEHNLITLVKEKKIQKPTTFTFNLTGKNTQKDNEIKLNSICGGIVQVYIEPVNTKERLFIFGAGHCAMELSALASRCGFYVTVIDDREEWLSKEKHPYAHRLIHCSFEEIEKNIKLNKNDYAVIMTHSHNHDKTVLKQLINKELKYTGMMGSKHKVNEIFNQLTQEGIQQEKLKKIYAPIGIPIGSTTPPEIAVSICAQLIKIKNNK